MSLIRLITFDVTGTLLKVTSPVGRQYSQAAEKFIGIKFDENSMQECFWKYYRQQMKQYPMFGSQHNMTSEQWWFSVFTNCIKGSKQLNTMKTFENSDAQLQKAFEDVYYNFKWTVYPGAKDTLKSLKSMKTEKYGPMKLAAVSNSDERTPTILKETNLSEYFDCVVSSVEARCEKPNPRIFDYTLKKLNLTDIDKNQILHVGNMYEKDYIAALNGGMQALLLRDESNENEKVFHKEHIIHELSEVVMFVGRNNKEFTS
uniref:haloacid dehalogenase-like hydrolase domain-containing protein 3 n=1 Tax=Styela clava TaxID=7725 RepID=UPI00193988F9|nr:haloacid dehalogenase-like hydrolase domain-containing protein 3 [Styela clava]